MNLEVHDDVSLVKLIRGLADQGLVLRSNPESGQLRIEPAVEMTFCSPKDFLGSLRRSPSFFDEPDLYFTGRR